MKTNRSKLSFRYLLFLPFLFFTFCENEVDVNRTSEVTQESFTKNSRIASLIKDALGVDTSLGKSTNDQCVEFQYPIIFYAILPTSQSIETVIISNDEELFNFFDTLTETTEIRIDFPTVLLGTDGEQTVIENMEQLEDTLEIAVDACRGSNDYEYCDDDNKKVYICHNGHTICVSVNAINAHLAHGDVLGHCNE